MDRPDDASATTRTTYQRETDTRWAHRNLGGAWWLALAAVPLLLAALVTGIKGGDIEKDLDARATAALSDAGLTGVDVSFDGRDAAVTAASGASVSAVDLERARGLVTEVAGVRGVDVDSVGATASGSEEPTPSPSEEPSAEPTPSEEPSEEPSATGEPASDCTPEAVRGSISEIVGADRITFRLHKTSFAGASADEVAAVGVLLAGCPDLSVAVTGNTGRKFAGSDLSQRRAEVVKQALVSAGVNAASISTEGARDSDPLGSFETPQGRAKNRYADIVVK